MTNDVFNHINLISTKDYRHLWSSFFSAVSVSKPSDSFVFYIDRRKEKDLIESLSFLERLKTTTQNSRPNNIDDLCLSYRNGFSRPSSSSTYRFENLIYLTNDNPGGLINSHGSLDNDSLYVLVESFCSSFKAHFGKGRNYLIGNIEIKGIGRNQFVGFDDLGNSWGGSSLHESIYSLFLSRIVASGTFLGSVSSIALFYAKSTNNLLSYPMAREPYSLRISQLNTDLLAANDFLFLSSIDEDKGETYFSNLVFQLASFVHMGFNHPHFNHENFCVDGKLVDMQGIDNKFGPGNYTFMFSVERDKGSGELTHMIEDLCDLEGKDVLHAYCSLVQFLNTLHIYFKKFKQANLLRNYSFGHFEDLFFNYISQMARLTFVDSSDCLLFVTALRNLYDNCDLDINSLKIFTIKAFNLFLDDLNEQDSFSKIQFGRLDSVVSGHKIFDSTSFTLINSKSEVKSKVHNFNINRKLDRKLKLSYTLVSSFLKGKDSLVDSDRSSLTSTVDGIINHEQFYFPFKLDSANKVCHASSLSLDEFLKQNLIDATKNLFFDYFDCSLAIRKRTSLVDDLKGNIVFSVSGHSGRKEKFFPVDSAYIS